MSLRDVYRKWLEAGRGAALPMGDTRDTANNPHIPDAEKMAAAKAYLAHRGGAVPPSRSANPAGLRRALMPETSGGSWSYDAYESDTEKARRYLGIYTLVGNLVASGMSDEAAIERALVLSDKIEGAFERIERVNAAVSSAARTEGADRAANQGQASGR